MSASSAIGVTAGGIDVATLVSQLMSIERNPLVTIQNRQATVKLQGDALDRLRTNVESLKSVAAGLVAGGMNKMASSVSNTSAVSASVSSTATPGAVSFTVDQLARAQGMRTVSTVTNSSSIITTAASLAVSTTAGRLGAGAIQVGAGVTAGKYTVTVNQATAGASRTGTSALASSTVVTGSNNTIDIELDGVAHAITIASGTYTAAGLASAVQAGIDAAGGGATATTDSSGRLKLTSTHEGSTASLQVMGGTALADLGLGVDGSAAVGIDGSIQIGTNTAVTVTSAGTGATVAVGTGSGDLTLTLDGGLRTGSSTVAVVSTGDRSLTAVASAINGAGVGASAAAVKTADNSWLLQVNATSTGSANALSLDASLFAGAGGLVETSAAQDAKITIGSGIGAYSVTASGNVFTDVLPGVTLTALAETATAVNVSVTRDTNATATAVEKFVTAASSVIADINLQSKYNTTTKTAGPLAGVLAVRQLAEQVRSAVTSIVGEASTNLASNVGITVERTGTFKFDRAKFLEALEADPAAVERLFGRGGSSTNGVTFAGALDTTVAGSYAVEVTAAAARASTGDVLVGGSPLGQTVGVRLGTVTASYAAAPGATAADIAAGLNQAIAEAGLAINVEVSGGGVRLTANSFGSAGTFETNLDVTGAGNWSANVGTDVAGTIDGKTAVGVGQRLKLLATADSRAKGLEIDVAEGVSGSLGPVSYDPGVAARIVALATVATDTDGPLTTASETLDTRYEAFNDQIDRFEERMVIKEAQLRRQWTTVQTLLASLENQQSWLTSQIDSLSG